MTLPSTARVGAFFATDNGLAVASPDGQWEIFQQFDESAPLPDDPNTAFVGLPFAVDTNVVRSVTFDGEFMWLVMGRGQTRESADGTFVTINPAGSIVRRRPELSNEEGLNSGNPKTSGRRKPTRLAGWALDTKPAKFIYRSVVKGQPWMKFRWVFHHQ